MIDADYPVIVCPNCGDKQRDLDGFGFLACVACGHCTHPVASGLPGAPLACEICGAVIEAAA